MGDGLHPRSRAPWSTMDRGATGPACPEIQDGPGGDGAQSRRKVGGARWSTMCPHWPRRGPGDLGCNERRPFQTPGRGNVAVWPEPRAKGQIAPPRTRASRWRHSTALAQDWTAGSARRIGAMWHGSRSASPTRPSLGLRLTKREVPGGLPRLHGGSPTPGTGADHNSAATPDDLPLAPGSHWASLVPGGVRYGGGDAAGGPNPAGAGLARVSRGCHFAEPHPNLGASRWHSRPTTHGRMHIR